jgi:hypothetical protein
MKTTLMMFVKVGLLIIVLSSSLSAGPPDVIFRKFDEFGDTNCEDEMAHLDNFAIQLLAEPDKDGVLIFYGGRRSRGRLPKRGEAAARAARLKPYLVQRRGLPAEHISIINGGYADQWRVELWIGPRGVGLPTPSPSVPASKIKFRKGKVRPRDFRCRI